MGPVLEVERSRFVLSRSTSVWPPLSIWGRTPLLHGPWFISFYLQTQSCYWRSTSKNSRSRRETEGIEEEEKAVNETMSESLNLFQAIHVLQSNEDEADYRNQTNAGKLLHSV